MKFMTNKILDTYELKFTVLKTLFKIEIDRD